MPAVGPDGASEADPGADGASGAILRGTGRPSVLRRGPSYIQGEVLDKPARPSGSVLGAVPRGGAVACGRGVDVTHSAASDQPQDDATHSPQDDVNHAGRKYDLRPRRVNT